VRNRVGLFAFEPWCLWPRCLVRRWLDTSYRDVTVIIGTNSTGSNLSQSPARDGSRILLQTDLPLLKRSHGSSVISLSTDPLPQVAVPNAVLAPSPDAP